MDQRWDYMKMTFKYFQIQKWMLQTDRVEKVDKVNGLICLVSMFAFLVLVLKLSKNYIFCNLVLISARNLILVR